MLLIGALVASGAGCASSARRDERRATLFLRVGTEELKTGEYPSALRNLLKAEKLSPDNPIIQNNLGLAYFVREHYVEAERHVRKAIEQSPQYTDARNNLGRILIELHRYDDGIAELQRVLKDLTYAEPEKAKFNLGLAYFNKRDFKTAKSYFFDALRMKRENCGAQTYYGRSLLELQDFGRAAEILDAAGQFCVDNNREEARYFSGVSYYRLGRTEQAIGRLEEVIHLYPNGTYARRAESLLQTMMK